MWSPVLALSALLQVTLMPHLAIAGVQPDLVLAAVVSWALHQGPTDGAVGGILAGLALDLLSGAPFGMHSFAMTIVGAAAGLAAALVPREHAMLLPGMAILCTVLQQATCVWVLRAAGWPLDWSQAVVTMVIPAALLNLSLTVILYPLVGRLRRQVSREEPGW
ncbi:MAG: rod shape-determining protein MreD [Anaerolineae bacterium]|nr:rod shape-determining protein MreD [Anaerolineae bacterium]